MTIKLKPSVGGKTPAITLTAYAGAADARKALDAEFDAHIAKPVEVVEICASDYKTDGHSGVHTDVSCSLLPDAVHDISRRRMP